jgi:hypothetical protein
MATSLKLILIIITISTLVQVNNSARDAKEETLKVTSSLKEPENNYLHNETEMRWEDEGEEKTNFSFTCESSKREKFGTTLPHLHLFE